MVVTVLDLMYGDSLSESIQLVVDFGGIGGLLFGRSALEIVDSGAPVNALGIGEVVLVWGDHAFQSVELPSVGGAQLGGGGRLGCLPVMKLG